MSPQNGLLSMMPRDVQARLQAQSQQLYIPERIVLCDLGEPSRYAYFPLDGMVSLLSMTDEGNTVEVATIGKEGMIGVPIVASSSVSPYQANVQLPTHLLRVTADTLKAELSRSPALHGIWMDYAHRLLGQMAQTAVCHRFHTVRQRLCRWLLTARDRAEGDTLAFTQESLAQTLGVPRTGVTAVAVELQDAGAIRCRHGRITVLNRARLGAGSCECYRILRSDVHAPPAASLR